MKLRNVSRTVGVKVGEQAYGEGAEFDCPAADAAWLVAQGICIRVDPPVAEMVPLAESATAASMVGIAVAGRGHPRAGRRGTG
jgi:hypothetical protein